MLRKKSLLLALVLVLSVFAVGCGNNEDKTATEETSLQDIVDKGVLVLGCDDEFPPMGFVDDSGEVVGFDIDLAKAVCEELGVELEVKPIDWSAKEMELKSENIDVIWNGYSITADRNENVEFTKPYLNNEQMLVVRADSEINSVEDLADKAIGCQMESAAEGLVSADESLSGLISEVKSYNTYQQALLDLDASDNIAAVAVDKILIEYVMQQSPDKYRLLDYSLGKEYFGIGCREGSVTLREAIDNALDTIMENGKADEISQNWFESNIIIRDVDKLTQEELEEA